MSKSLSEQVANLETYLAEALVENRYLEAENAELRAGRGRWPEKADDFPCCTDTPPRLTVHKLNVAPVGSCLSRGVDSDERRKWEDGLWQGAWMFEGQRAETSEELIADGWADATLVLPEGQR